jgi:transcriptional regulator with XRE-family HTH domain
MRTHQLSSEQAALRLGVSKSTVLTLLRAETRYPTLATVEALRDCVGVPDAYLALELPATLPTQIPMTALPETLRQYRRTHALTQEQMARRLRCSPQTIGNLEYRRYHPSPGVLKALCRELQVTLTDAEAP